MRTPGDNRHAGENGVAAAAAAAVDVDEAAGGFMWPA
jgi:hypothetical protein